MPGYARIAIGTDAILMSNYKAKKPAHLWCCQCEWGLIIKSHHCECFAATICDAKSTAEHHHKETEVSFVFTPP